MKNCTECKYAEWRVTAIGRLHPSGDGRCKYPFKIPELPGAFYWPFGEREPCGGAINRHKNLADHCVYFARKQ